MQKYNFNNKEDAEKWRSRVNSISIHDNRHNCVSSLNNFTVTENLFLSEETTDTVFIHGSIVYHSKYGKCRVQGDCLGNLIYCYCYSDHDYFSVDIHSKKLSFLPDIMSLDISDRKLDINSFN